MPSHSKKQHNFMEAIAHSPSFAKKAGVPQSVGKDYAAADKGKTFGKGGEMKESKAMVGKEVAFFKKKGAPAKMIKHEMSEMKGMKAGGKVRRMAYGGMGEGDPFARDIDYEKEKERGAKTVEGIKNFLGFGKKEETKPNPIPVEGSKPVSSNSPTANAVTSPVTSSAVKTQERASAPNNRTLPVLNEESDNKDRMLSGPQFTSSIVDRGEGEYSGDGLSPAKGPSTPNRKPRTVSVEKNKTKVTASSSGQRSGPTEYERELEERKRRLNSEKLLKDAEEETLRKKPTAMTEQMRKAPTIRELYKGQKSMGDEIGDALKSFRASIRSGLKIGEERSKNRNAEASAAKGGQVKRMRYGGSPDDGMDMGQPMRGMASPPAPRGGPMPAMGPEMNPNSIAALQAKYGMRPQGGPPMKAGGSVKKMAEGGYAKADGAASRGKTQPKMVKMASGGFVKSADGCAQRGKTKAFQVKMSRGGKC